MNVDGREIVQKVNRTTVIHSWVPYVVSVGILVAGWLFGGVSNYFSNLSDTHAAGAEATRWIAENRPLLKETHDATIANTYWVQQQTKVLDDIAKALEKIRTDNNDMLSRVRVLEAAPQNRKR